MAYLLGLILLHCVVGHCIVLLHGVMGHCIVLLHSVVGHRIVLLHGVLGHLVLRERNGGKRCSQRDDDGGSEKQSTRRAFHDSISFQHWFGTTSVVKLNTLWMGSLLQRSQTCETLAEIWQGFRRQDDLPVDGVDCQ